jgi:hypothetical protein
MLARRAESPGRKGIPFLGVPLLSRPTNHLNPILIFFVLGWVVVWGRGRRGASGRGALTVIPIPVVGNHPTTNFSLQVTNMRRSKITQGPEPWENALAPAVSGEPAGLDPAEKKAGERLSNATSVTMNPQTHDRGAGRNSLAVGMRTKVIVFIEKLLRDQFGWDERLMCKEMWRFVGVDPDVFKKYGVDACEWLGRLTANELSDAQWLGWFLSDLAIRVMGRKAELKLNTTNAVSAIHFPMVLKQIKVPSLFISRMAVGSEEILLNYYVRINISSWPWPLDRKVAIELLRKFNKINLVKALAAMADGDGTIGVSRKGGVFFHIAFGRDDLYEASLISMLLRQKFDIKVTISKHSSGIKIRCHGDNAVQILSELLPFMTHPMRTLRTRLILLYRSKELSRDEFRELYNQTMYKNLNDLKRYNALGATAEAAPQTHTHGRVKQRIRNKVHGITQEQQLKRQNNEQSTYSRKHQTQTHKKQHTHNTDPPKTRQS